jgi:hypothetical protein
VGAASQLGSGNDELRRSMGDLSYMHTGGECTNRLAGESQKAQYRCLHRLGLQSLDFSPNSIYPGTRPKDIMGG